MAYNSDGYIMIDFTEVDFRRTNQTIDGLYKRCVDVIGTNKFILVINANGRTPLPATCSFTNNQYVIDTCIYMFAISSNDNLFIRRNDVPASDIIDDDSISVDKTWSSNKIDSELSDKAEIDDTTTSVSKTWSSDKINTELSDKAEIDDTTTSVSKTWSSDKINTELSDKAEIDDTTTSISKTWSSDKLNKMVVKSFTYTGTGSATNEIVFPTKWNLLLHIEGMGTNNNNVVNHYPIINGKSPYIKIDYFRISAAIGETKDIDEMTDTTLKFTMSNDGVALNRNGIEYTVYYI